jgi:cellulose synthase/poly-beta-1,6-N-acetylglucosamine synthase-like glycosyltransferase
MISIIITSWKEPKTIGKCIKCIVDRKYSGLNEDFEVIQVSPDKETLEAGLYTAKKLHLNNKEFIQIQDPRKGKPSPLKLAFKKARGDIWILTDGDTYFEKNAVKYLIEPFKNSKVGGVSGRPAAMNKKNSMFGYWGHLLSDAAHHRRIITMNKKEGNYYLSDQEFFPMSGYIMAVRNFNFDIPPNVLSDDAYLSYSIRNIGKEIAYAPLAKCYVKYPTNLKDYYKQKVRSLGGFIQLEEFGVFQKDKQSRSFLIELKYASFVLKYATNFKEFIWSLTLFPVRLITWIKIFWERVILKKDMPKTGWERIQSTK